MKNNEQKWCGCHRLGGITGATIGVYSTIREVVNTSKGPVLRIYCTECMQYKEEPFKKTKVV